MVMSLFFYYSFLCFVLLISECFSSSFDHHHLCSPTEASALIKFKQSFQNMSEEYYRDWSDGDCSPKTKSWNESRDCCSWDGVTCDLLNGHVIGLDLSCSQIVVTFHPNSTLFQLHHLHTLNLAYNHFNYSSIPHNIGRLANLRHLNLSDAWFQGKIPTEISYLSNLVSLDLSYSYGLQLDERTFVTMLHNLTNLELLSLSEVNISSPIPLNISSSLRYLDLDNTNLRGVLTESFFHLPNSLETLKLSSNDLLKGVFPKIHRRNTLLMELDISDTGISGELPDSVGTFSSLNILNLQRCHFSGSIPDSIGNLTQITELDFSHNNFTGHIPSTISKLKHLTGLHLSSNSFSGEITDVFSNLQQLRYLYLFRNSFIGLFPTSILNLRRLERLDMSSNSLSSPLPKNASILQNLNYLDLSYNSLNGTIPSWVFSLPLLSSVSLHHNRFRGIADEVIKTNPTLERLDLSHNQLSGSFAQSLANLKNLYYLDLSSNKITNDITGINITFPSLGFLHLSSCELKDIPYLLRNVKTLVYLDISNNKISGQIPKWFSGMRWDSLQFLNLSHNSLTGNLPRLHYYTLQYLDLKFNSLQGPLPSSICNMSSLILLDLSRNNISNSIPSCLGSMANLTVLDLRKNNFTEVFGIFKAMIKLDNEDTGEIKYMRLSDTSYEDSVTLVIKGQDIELQRISTIMTTIDLSSNHFEGVIPKTLKDLSSLWLLNLSHNNIRGDIPMELGQLNTLEALDLSWNRLTGMIPQELTRMNFLAFLNLSQNHLIGPIPHGLQFNTFGNDSYGSNLDLCGPPLSKQCGTSDSSHLPQPLEEEEDESESYFFSGFTWESVVIGYSFGLVVGTVMWSLMFKYRKPKWFVEFF
nr:receptor-like protein Cf-9 homolog isoform X1 [Solanum lycopersicum]XP_010313797.1 receptor-like protein Cf-9 homolog isoform X1 [Solanum lycopersicum]